MCGIVGYIGKKNAAPILIEGLKRESYRGYDSSGLVVLQKAGPICIKTVGKLEKLEEKIYGFSLEGNIGIAHNRWATHGTVTEANAHPQLIAKKIFT